MLIVKSDVKELTKDLTALEKRQVPYATVLAINTVGWKLTGYRGKEGILPKALPAHIDRPRLKNPFFFQKALKQKPWGEVKFKDKGGKVFPARYYLPQVYGGAREAKRHEVSLRRMGILGPDEYTVPGEGMKLDRFGNLTGATYSKILADVNNTRDFLGRILDDIKHGFGQRTTKKGKKKYFYDPNLRPRGIWVRRSKKRVFPALVFIKAPRYTQRFPMEDLADYHATKRFPGAFTRALDKAMKTAR